MSTDAKEMPDNVVILSDIDLDELAANQPAIELFDPSHTEDGESRGFNPYDTGRLQKHKIERSKG